MRSKEFIYSLFSLFIIIVFTYACARPRSGTPAQKRAYVNQMREQTLDQLYAKYPYARKQVERAAGYAVFSNVNTQVIFFGGGGGYGVAVDNSNGQKTYMRMAQATAGLGVGLKDFREVIIFKNPSTFDKFVISGWDFGVEAGAGVKSGEKGGDVGGALSVADNVIVYQLTEAGVELKTTVSGKKYWLYNELNFR